MTTKVTKDDKFLKTLKVHKKQIDIEIAKFCEQALSETHEQFGEYPLEAVKAYCEILSRGGKRIRGTLAMISYEMFGGTDKNVAIKSALAVEMLHAYILMIDDIQDSSETRRRGQTAHIVLKNYHEKASLKGDSQHFGESIALNGSLFGVHSALNIIADLDVEAQRKIDVMKSINNHFVITAHGQTSDIFNEALETANESDVDRVLAWKTAYYTFMNPLTLGAILAGAQTDDLQKLESYSLYAGRVFQITDDILGVFGERQMTGKSPLDDIRQGKRTLLTVKALEFAPKADAYFLEQMLGNNKITQANFRNCQDIIRKCGALDYARRKAKDSVVDAVSELHNVKKSWGAEQVDFLRSLVKFLPRRTA